MLSGVFLSSEIYLERYFCSVSSAEQSKNTLSNSTTHRRDVCLSLTASLKDGT